MRLMRSTAGLLLTRSILTAAAVVAFSMPAAAAPFQLVKVFDTPLVGTEQFDFLIEVQALGVWIEVPCIDGKGSCTYTFTDLAAGTSVVLADSSLSWFTGGSYYVRETAPAGWSLQLVTSVGTTTLAPNLSNGEVYFSFQMPDADGGHVTLHNVGPAVPEPGTMALFGLGMSALGVSRRRRSLRVTS